MGNFKKTTVEVKFGGKIHRVSQGVADSLKAGGKLDGQKKKTSKTDK